MVVVLGMVVEHWSILWLVGKAAIACLLFLLLFLLLLLLLLMVIMAKKKSKKMLQTAIEWYWCLKAALRWCASVEEASCSVSIKVGANRHDKLPAGAAMVSAASSTGSATHTQCM